MKKGEGAYATSQNCSREQVGLRLHEGAKKVPTTVTIVARRESPKRLPLSGRTGEDLENTSRSLNKYPHNSSAAGAIKKIAQAAAFLDNPQEKTDPHLRDR